MPARRAAQLSASRLVLGLLLLTLPAAAGAATLHRVGFLPGTADPRFSVVGGAQGNVYFHGLATPSPPSTAAFANVRWSQPTGLELFAGLGAPQPTPEITGGTPFGTTIDAQGQVVAEFDALGRPPRGRASCALGPATPVPSFARP